MSIIPELKTRQVQTLNELSKRKVVEHNSLITSIAKMDKTPLKMFELAVSLIDTDNPPKDHTVYLSKQELFAFFKVTDNDKHSRFKEAIQSTSTHFCKCLHHAFSPSAISQKWE